MLKDSAFGPYGGSSRSTHVRVDCLVVAMLLLLREVVHLFDLALDHVEIDDFFRWRM
jgi:hypothetical protein